MNQKFNALYAQVAAENHLHFDAEKAAIYGTAKGYSLCLMPYENNQTVLYVSVSKFGAAPDKQDMKAIVKSTKSIASYTVQRYKVGFMLRLSGKADKMSLKLQEAINAIAAGLHQGNYENCCENCGQAKETAACQVSGTAKLLCDDCFATLSSDADLAAQTKMQKHENVVGGACGALLGSLIGVVVIVILSQLGYVAALSGVVMAVCTLKGYEMLGGKLSNKGIVISCIVIVAMVYLGDRVDWAIRIAGAFDVDIFSSFRAVPALVSEEVIDFGSYLANLVMLYLFAALGAVPAIFGAVKARSAQLITGKMQENKDVLNVL